MKAQIKNTLTGAALLLSIMASASAAIVVVTDDISSNTTWTNTNEYVLQASANQGVIRVLPGATLTIAPGTIIRGQPRTDASTYDAGSLAVLRGGKIAAQGTATNPIVFTTAAVDNDDDGQPDGFTRNGAPGSGAGASVIADRYDAGSFVKFWDNDPKNSPQPPTMTGLWGGVLVLGRAPVNYANVADTTPPANTLELVQDGNPSTPYYYTKPIVEGLDSPDYAYGSDWDTTETVNGYTGKNYVDADDNSGVLSYISIRHGGIQLAADNEINGLTLAGVGRGTQVDHIEVWGNEDDGIEIFGGTVNLSYLAIFSTKDDGLDIDQGYTGQIQFALVVGGSYGEKLLEWDGDDADEFSTAGKGAKANFEPRGSWEARNLTLIALPTLNPSSSAGDGANIRHNASSKLHNVIIANIAGNRHPVNAQTTFWNVISHYTYNSDAGASAFTAETVQSNGNGDATTADLFGAINTATTSYTGDTANLVYLAPSGATPGLYPLPDIGFGDVLNVSPVPLGNQTFFQNVGYRGAFDPDGDIWTTGWTAASASNAVN